ncbi:zinc-binding oxidoreductase ToxD [Cordyceps fumosorosea ARSEF 2679]|uniref:Zinc-binding oxidoreductase ToxD n=1 Tax=Cordyceps fumosorosea (strain ARSEF 2679) TaxID=1081104 RepID=A0A162JL76_CORFA|nr:zinc-binding oxidoreductase ToxD [Cordyceps fumosorosea ARSEF 2679]OAA70602.1 zinc-binding oxidoreductase ToxD [Cordyceps fumosorosea ARSEF 2679]
MSEPKAIICTGPGKLEIQPVAKQQLPPGYILVKTKAVALNPTDWKAIHDPSGFAAGTRPGVDFSGIVEEVGPDVKKNFKTGDRVCGIAFGAKDREHGAFGEYTITKEHVAVKIPDHLSFEQAATLGVGVTTCGQALYQLLNLPLPSSTSAAAGSSPQTILIGGGSTATAVLGIQYAALSGLRVLATASPRHHAYLRSLGASALLDYHEPAETLVAEIKALVGDGLTLTWDCAPGDGKFPEVAARAMSASKEGIFATVAPLTPRDSLRERNPMVEARFQLGYTAFGEAFERGANKFPASQEDAEFAAAFWERSAGLLAEKKLRPIEPTVDRGGKGLQGVLVGLEELRQGKVSGTKLVYTL